MKIKNLPQLILSIFLCQGAGILGSFYTISAIPTWYAALNKPVFSPPNWLFGPAWLTWYTMMGVAFYLIWQKSKAKGANFAINLFITHLAVNVLWSVVFFGQHNIFGGIVVILILWSLILTLIIKFFSISRAAAYLLVPYLLWVSFATLLNVAVFALNK